MNPKVKGFNVRLESALTAELLSVANSVRLFVICRLEHACTLAKR